MKTVQYDLRIIHRKKVAIGAINRKEIDRILRDMITSGEALNMEGGEVVGIVVEEKGERDCPGDCDHCPYLCPENEDCMMDDLGDRCRSCEYGCEKCGLCSLIDYGVKIVIGAARSAADVPIRKEKNSRDSFSCRQVMSRRRRERSAGGVGYTIPASNAFGLPDCCPAVLRQLVREKSLKPFRKCGGKNEDDPVYRWSTGGRYDRRGYDVPYADQPSVQT